MAHGVDRYMLSVVISLQSGVFVCAFTTLRGRMCCREKFFLYERNLDIEH